MVVGSPLPPSAHHTAAVAVARPKRFCLDGIFETRNWKLETAVPRYKYLRSLTASTTAPSERNGPTGPKYAALARHDESVLTGGQKLVVFPLEVAHTDSPPPSPLVTAGEGQLWPIRHLRKSASSSWGSGLRPTFSSRSRTISTSLIASSSRRPWKTPAWNAFAPTMSFMPASCGFLLKARRLCHGP